MEIHMQNTKICDISLYIPLENEISKQKKKKYLAISKKS
jgi:hypothetical protein